jgi:glycosyltransferase involved in cell wall biosynthesis
MRSVLLAKGRSRPHEILDAAAGRAPRIDGLAIAQSLGADIIDAEASGPATSPPSTVMWCARLSARLLKRKGQIDAIYSPSESLAIIAATTLFPTGWRGKLVFAAHLMSTAKLRVMGAFFNHMDCEAICVSRRQMEIMIDAGYARERVHHAYNWIDMDFFKPQSDPVEDYVFACGLENRDYATLMAAFERLPYRLIIAASGYHGVDRSLRGCAPSNVEILSEKVPWSELRRLYARARFVVTPLNNVDYAAGVTGLVEAMAMGKAIVASTSAGIAEYLRDGASVRAVRPGSATELAQAVTELWDDPEYCRRAGAWNRAWVARASLDNYINKVRSLLFELN